MQHGARIEDHVPDIPDIGIHHAGVRVASIRTLTPMATRIATSAICDASAWAIICGQPTSNNVEVDLKCSAVAFAAGADESHQADDQTNTTEADHQYAKPDLKSNPQASFPPV
ncbi:hypothetical protein KCP69_06330 [Salmonella enterica subsp. enterica]|nr:hypothetical protein KCP69_06330 [Salmonella enterica subsp. enterica]